MKNILKNIFSRKTKFKINVGDTVIVTDTTDHYFKFGEIATYVKYGRTSGGLAIYKLRCSTGLCQWLLRSQFRKIEPPKQPINKLSVFASAVLFVAALIIGFMPSNSAADMGKVIACAAGLIGLGAVVYFFIYDPLTDLFCDSIDNANSLTEDQDY